MDGTKRRILWVWSTPRSMSTLLAKCISRLDGVTVVHEPFTDAYYFSERRRSSRYGDASHGLLADPWRYASAANFGPGMTFVKELAFQAAPYVDGALLAQSTNAFLYRHPARVAQSLLPLKPDFTEDEFGFTALDVMIRKVANLRGRPALMMNGDHLREDPESFLRDYCEYASLNYSSHALAWPKGPFREWKEHEADSQRKWHAQLEASTGIVAPDLSLESPPNLPPEQRAIYDNALRLYESFEAMRDQLTGVTDDKSISRRLA